MTRRVLALALLFGCGRSIAPVSDGGFSFERFAADLEAQSASCTTGNCAAPFSAVAVASPAEAHARVLAVVAKVFGATVSQVTANGVTQCSAPDANCATRFNHDLYKGDGCRGDALLPSARLVLDQAASVEYAIWSANLGGITTPAAITLAGIKDGRLLGLMFFFDRTSCRDG